MLITKKSSPFSVSILNNSNKIISSTQDNLGGLRPGSYIKIDNDEVLYPVTKTQSIFYSKSFSNNKNREITIDDYSGAYLQKEDIIKIFHDKHAFGSVIKITSNGEHYREEEIVTLLGGDLSINNIDGQVYPARLLINRTGPKGEILSLSKTNPEENGDYIAPPTGEIDLVSSNEGRGAKIKAQFELFDSQTYLTRTIKNISQVEGKTKILLDYSIDPNIKKGIISAEKWEVHLAYNYLGETRNNAPYEIFKDFTPNCQIPLLIKNSKSIELLHNQGMILIDYEFKNIKERLCKLEKKFN